MDIHTTVEGNKATVAVVGKITVQTAPDLDDALKALEDSILDIDLDLSEMDYTSSAGLRVMVAAQKNALARGGTLRLLHPNKDVMEVFEMTGLADIFTIED